MSDFGKGKRIYWMTGRSVNDTKVRNLRQLVELIEGGTNEFVRLGIDFGEKRDAEFVFDAAQMREATPRILKRFQIPADRSDDLRTAR